MAGVMSRQNYESFPSDTKVTSQPLKVSVCTSANAINVQGFIDELSRKFPDLNLDVQFYELPYNDIDHCEIKGSEVNIMILCHSINNRRFAITDVMDALYDIFLPNSAKILGKARVCVLVHDFPSSKGLSTPDRYKAEVGNFESMQGSTFKHSSLVMMCGKLDGPVEMQENNWEELKKFLVKAAMTPMPSKPCLQPPCDFSRRRWLYFILVVLVIIAVVAVGLSVGLGKSPPAATTTPTLPGSTPTSATTPTTISPTETTQPPTTVPTTETDTPLNPTTLPTTGTDTPPNPTTLPTTGTDTPPNPTTLPTTGTDTPSNPATVPTTGTDTPPNPTTLPTTETDTPPNPTAANKPSRARG